MTQGYHAISAADYHADKVAGEPALSSSIAQILIRESPLKAWHSHPRLNPKFKRKEESKFDLGTCAHAVLLENDASKIVIVQADDWRTKAAKEQRDAARAAGKTPLLEKHYDDVRKMVDAALAYIAESEIGEYWFEAQSELTGVVNEAGIWLKARFDKITVSKRVIMDYKTTDNASPEVFSRQIVRMDYHVQDAFYRRVARSLGAVDDPRFVFLAQSCDEPYECSLHACDPAMQQIADAEVERAIQLWRRCIEQDEWPSYGGRVHYAMPTTYQLQEHELREMETA